MTDTPPSARDRKRAKWQAEVDRDLDRILAITAGIFACILAVFALIIWWVRS